MTNIEQHFGERTYDAVIRATVKLREAASFGLPIREYKERSGGAEDYMELAAEVIADETKLDVKESTIQLGPRRIGDDVVFTYRDPVAAEVQIAGDFSNWEPVENVIQRQDYEIWQGAIHLESGIHQYKFIVDGEWKTDPCNAAVTTSGIGVPNSLVTVSNR